MGVDVVEIDVGGQMVSWNDWENDLISALRATVPEKELPMGDPW
jgi:hypothetical protein